LFFPNNTFYTLLIYNICAIKIPPYLYFNNIQCGWTPNGVKNNQIDDAVNHNKYWSIENDK
jgi:hypothetical protein